MLVYSSRAASDLQLISVWGEQKELAGSFRWYLTIRQPVA